MFFNLNFVAFYQESLTHMTFYWDFIWLLVCLPLCSDVILIYNWEGLYQFQALFLITFYKAACVSQLDATFLK